MSIKLFKMPNVNKLPNLASVRGVGMLEVLVSILVLGVGALGVASMQMTGLKFSSGSQGRSQAIIAAYDMMDRISSNREVALDLTADEYGVAAFSGSGDVTAPATDCYNAQCSPSQLAAFDLYYFLKQVEESIPFGQATIVGDDSAGVVTYTITIQWRDVVNRQNRDGFTPDPDLELSTFVFTSAI